MIAFHGNQELKTGLLAEVEKHRLADQIVGGTYGDERDGVWHGCAVGCSIRSYNNLHGSDIPTSSHKFYEEGFGIPLILAKLEDKIFEGLPNELKGAWPGRFFNAITPGADLSKVWPEFAIWLLVDANNGVIRYATSVKSKSAIERVAELYRIGGTKEQFIVTRKAAAADAYASASAAAAAAAAAAYAASAEASASAAAAAADASASAAASAASAAAYAASAEADASAAAAAAARQKAFVAQSEKLLELMAAAK